MNHQASRSQPFTGFGHSWFFGYSTHLLCLAVFKHKWTNVVSSWTMKIFFFGGWACSFSIGLHHCSLKKQQCFKCQNVWCNKSVKLKQCESCWSSFSWLSLICSVLFEGLWGPRTDLQPNKKLHFIFVFSPPLMEDERDTQTSRGLYRLHSLCKCSVWISLNQNRL